MRFGVSAMTKRNCPRTRLRVIKFRWPQPRRWMNPHSETRSQHPPLPWSLRPFPASLRRRRSPSNRRAAPLPNRNRSAYSFGSGATCSAVPVRRRLPRRLLRHPNAKAAAATGTKVVEHAIATATARVRRANEIESDRNPNVTGRARKVHAIRSGASARVASTAPRHTVAARANESTSKHPRPRKPRTVRQQRDLKASVRLRKRAHVGSAPVAIAEVVGAAVAGAARRSLEPPKAALTRARCSGPTGLSRPLPKRNRETPLQRQAASTNLAANSLARSSSSPMRRNLEHRSSLGRTTRAPPANARRRPLASPNDRVAKQGELRALPTQRPTPYGAPAPRARAAPGAAAFKPKTNEMNGGARTGPPPLPPFDDQRRAQARRCRLRTSSKSPSAASSSRSKTCSKPDGPP